ncbi:MAG TPA: ion channel [Acetobacteraceae bacterium]|nr:ion channel [Acetobacteraceae bacterium]
MTLPPTRVRNRTRHRPWIALDVHWLRSTVFTVALVALVAFAIGADGPTTVSSLVTCGVGFGFFYLLFAGGAHFGMTVANFLAIYACVFEFFRQANFPLAPRPLAFVAIALPVLGFLAGCFWRRRQVYSIIHARRIRELERLPRVTVWFAGALAVGASSFALPRLELNSDQQGLALIAAMGVIALFVIASVRDVVLVMIDVAMVFEGVAARLDRLIRPLIAFLTFYALLVVVFGCLYRIADMTTPEPQFTLHSVPARIGFIDAMYYSVATITTLGFGDIAPASLLVRALTGMEVVSGVLMLLFGFSEIMRSAGPDRPDRRPPLGGPDG